MKLKVIFDKETSDDKYSIGWGLAYIIGKKTLFDTGEKSEYTLNNLKALSVDIQEIERVVISHNHWNHLGGLWDLLKINNNLEIFACSDFATEFKDRLTPYSFKLVDSFSRICDNIYTTGPFKIRHKDKEINEQALLLKTNKGISIICGCSHPGILRFIDQAKKAFPEDKLYAVLGGFHLIDKDNRTIRYFVEELKKYAIENVGPSHCTGFEAINIFREAYSNNFWDIKVGKEIEL